MTPLRTRGIEPLIRVGADFENEYPGAETLATECFANIWRTAELLMGLHNRHTSDQYQLSPSARGVLAVVEGAGQPLEPSVIAERLVVTTGSMTSHSMPGEECTCPSATTRALQVAARVRMLSRSVIATAGIR